METYRAQSAPRLRADPVQPRRPVRGEVRAGVPEVLVGHHLRHRCGEEEALGGITRGGLYVGQLLGGLDPFGDDREPQRVAELGDGLKGSP
jgi:hypothetical protein